MTRHEAFMRFLEVVQTYQRNGTLTYEETIEILHAGTDYASAAAEDVVNRRVETTLIETEATLASARQRVAW